MTAVFAPRNPAEFARVLAPGGEVVVVHPGPEHLQELVSTLGLLTVDPDKQARVGSDFATDFDPVAERRHQVVQHFTAQDVAATIAMGPNAFHTDPGAVAAVAADIAPLSVTTSVVARRFRRRGGAAVPPTLMLPR